MAVRPLTAAGAVKARAAQQPGATATFHRSQSGAWTPASWLDLWQEIQNAAAAFHRLGLTHGDRLAIMARSSRDWQIAEIAAACAGASVVGVDPFASSEQVQRVLAHSRASALIVGDGDALNKLAPSWRSAFKFVLSFESTGESRSVALWRDTVSSARNPHEERLPDPSAPAVVIYTSGTTGEPKGIEYSHQQIMTACWAMLDAFPGLDESRVVCWLPMSALFQRMMNIVAFCNGSTTYFVEDPRTIMSNLPEIRPHVLTSVPRMYEKVYQGIQERLSTRSPLVRRLFEKAVSTGREWVDCRTRGSRPSLGLRARHFLLDALALKPVRSAMGGSIQLMISGSAAAPIWILDFFDAIGMPILEAYGVTENAVPVAANTPANRRIGSVGKPLPPNVVRISDEGEVLVKGPALFSGYLDDPTAGRFTSDGYYRTGDVGHLDGDGFLFLTGRASDVIKTSTGRRVAPAAVEAHYRQSRYIEQIFVIGHNRPYLVALVAVNRSTVDERMNTDQVHDLIKRELDQCGEGLSPHERVRAFALLDPPPSIESGELTTTLKPRRARIESRHRDTIDGLYLPLSPAVSR